MTVASLPETAFELLYRSHLSLAEHFLFMVAHELVRELRQVDHAVGKLLHAD